jgi:hypothetical protein
MVLAGYFLAVSPAKSQEITDNQGSYFKFSLSYLSNSVYLGRKDSFVVPYIIPSISYHDKSGFFAEGSFSYLASQQGQIDEGNLTAGYDFHSKNEKFSGEIFATKYFVSQSSYAVSSEVKGSAGSYLDYNTGPITINGSAELSFSSNSDILLGFGLSHSFEFGKGNSWAIGPSAILNAGTENFYDSYFTKRKFSAKRKRRAVTVANVTVIKNSFSILDYELSAPLNYDGAKWGLFFTPTYSIPVNPVKYSLNNGVTYQTEVLSNTFYAEVGVYIKF